MFVHHFTYCQHRKEKRMNKEIEAKLERIKLDKTERKEKEKHLLKGIDVAGFKTQHFRTNSYGVVTVLYRQHFNSKYEYEVLFGFCGPVVYNAGGKRIDGDIFCKRQGRIEAFNNRIFFLYCPEGCPIDKMILDFLRYIIGNSTVTSKNRYRFETFYGFPRWLPTFLVMHFDGYRGFIDPDSIKVYPFALTKDQTYKVYLDNLRVRKDGE